MSFELDDHSCVLTKINPRKAKDHTYLDLNYETEHVSPEVLSTICGNQFQEIQDALWENGEDKNPRFLAIEDIKIWTSFSDGYKVKFKSARTAIEIEKVGKFHFKPRAGGMADLKFQMTIRNPSERLIAWLMESLSDPRYLTIWCVNEDILDGLPESM
jgi:hypothetical protein